MPLEFIPKLTNCYLDPDTSWVIKIEPGNNKIVIGKMLPVYKFGMYRQNTLPMVPLTKNERKHALLAGYTVIYNEIRISN